MEADLGATLLLDLLLCLAEQWTEEFREKLKLNLDGKCTY